MRQILMQPLPHGTPLAELVTTCVERKLAQGLARSKSEIARHFSISNPSLYGWMQSGRVSRERMPEVISYFRDVSTPEEWGFEDGQWPDWVQSARPIRVYLSHSMPARRVTDENQDLVQALGLAQEILTRTHDISDDERALLELYRTLDSARREQAKRILAALQ